MTTTAIECATIALGTEVGLTGIIVGRSEFQDGPPSYLVEYQQRGKPMRSWFTPSDFDEDEE